MNPIKKLIRKTRNFLAPQYSGCEICGDKWNWKKEHTFMYSEGRGSFPICEECWKTKSNDEIMRATTNLVATWLSQAPPNHLPETTENGLALIATVERDLRVRQK